MGNVIQVDGDYRYRPFETPDTPYIDMLLR
jgi:hypothetical protein